MRTSITKSRSGHYTVTIRSLRYPDIKVSQEKIDTLELARWFAREGGPLRQRLYSRVYEREHAGTAPLPDYQF
ncbi:hypothetical protein K6Y76_05105 [Burkholderia cenocepacia]|uniref:hypothetical protein n=1 Tax=Burkholderia cenocepacia TaxID=95486 RepID=UPI00222E37AD|nr:hypothetical protein [Burkholderia cenocepacia]MCW3521225.1 hypothetical protein [Burkholderia cenocepacia]MCW3612382.1 hypothetical protein [Burkholderia cenocepacia]MCW3650220.1 hypothetical protein [Burkholderia cenocepacia]MCW3664243.1 hypothetical protein [Burkholderia cenocepacia]MCW3678993.1 hypothetical protein [Burkholderia cenocepacia]